MKQILIVLIFSLSSCIVRNNKIEGYYYYFNLENEQKDFFNVDIIKFNSDSTFKYTIIKSNDRILRIDTLSVNWVYSKKNEIMLNLNPIPGKNFLNILFSGIQIPINDTNVRMHIYKPNTLSFFKDKKYKKYYVYFKKLKNNPNW